MENTPASNFFIEATPTEDLCDGCCENYDLTHWNDIDEDEILQTQETVVSTKKDELVITEKTVEEHLMNEIKNTETSSYENEIIMLPVD